MVHPVLCILAMSDSDLCTRRCRGPLVMIANIPAAAHYDHHLNLDLTTSSNPPTPPERAFPPLFDSSVPPTTASWLPPSLFRPPHRMSAAPTSLTQKPQPRDTERHGQI